MLFLSEVNRFRKKELRVKLSEEEYLMICDKAYSCNLTVSDAIRSLIVFGQINARWMDKESKELVDGFNAIMDKYLQEINHIGNNINEIAYNTNARHNAELEDLMSARYELIQVYQFFIYAVEEFQEYVKNFNSYGEGI